MKLRVATPCTFILLIELAGCGFPGAKSSDGINSSGSGSTGTSFAASGGFTPSGSVSAPRSGHTSRCY